MHINLTYKILDIHELEENSQTKNDFVVCVGYNGSKACRP